MVVAPAGVTGSKCNAAPQERQKILPGLFSTPQLWQKIMTPSDDWIEADGGLSSLLALVGTDDKELDEDSTGACLAECAEESCARGLRLVADEGS